MNNINLTLDYLQEEDSTQKVEEKEEDNNSFSTSFDLYSLNPGHKTYMEHWSNKNYIICFHLIEISLDF